MKESKKVLGKEIKYMEKGGAPKSLIKHEREEHKEMKRESKEIERSKKKRRSEFEWIDY